MRLVKIILSLQETESGENKTDEPEAKTNNLSIRRTLSGSSEIRKRKELNRPSAICKLLYWKETDSRLAR